MGVGVFLLVPFLMLVLSLVRGSSFGEALLFSSPWFVLMWGLTLVVFPWLQQRQIRNYHKSAPSLGGEQRFVLDPSGLHMTGALTNVDLQWKALTEIAETTEFFLFYFAKGFAYVLPQDAVGDEAEKERLRVFLAAQLPGRTRFARTGSMT